MAQTPQTQTQHPIGTLKHKGRVVLFLLWAAATAAVGVALFQEPEPIATNGVVIGKVAATSGKVRLLSRDSILWVDTVAGQSVTSGDTLSTGAASASTIALSQGRTLDVGPNSMITLEEETAGVSGREPTVALALLRGEVVASVAKTRPRAPAEGGFSSLLRRLSLAPAPAVDKDAKPAAIKVEAASKSFVIADAGASLSLTKANNAEAVVTSAKGAVTATTAGETVAVPVPAKTAAAKPVVELEGPENLEDVANDGAEKATTAAATPPANLAALAFELPTAATPMTPKTQKSSGRKLRAKAAPQPQPAVPKAPPVLPLQKLAIAVPQVAEPQEIPVEPVDITPPTRFVPRLGKTLPRSLATPLRLAEACRGGIDIAVPVTPPNGVDTAKTATWTPFVEATLTGQGGPAVRAEGRPEFAAQTLSLPVAQLCALKGGAVSETLSFTLRAGVRLREGGPEALSPKAKVLFLVSLAELPDRPVTVHLSRVAIAGGDPQGWLPLKSSKSGADQGAPLALTLVSTRLLARIYPLLAGNGFVVLSRQQKAAYAHRIQLASGNGTMLGNLASKERNDAVLRRVAAVLGAEIAFVGRPESIVSLPMTRLNRLNQLEAMVRNGTDITLISRQRAVLLRREDMQSNPQSIRALGVGATAAFKEAVEVVLPK